MNRLAMIGGGVAAAALGGLGLCRLGDPRSSASWAEASTFLRRAVTDCAQHGDPAAESTIHWAFGSFLGTGVYRLSDERGAFVLKIPMRWTASQTAAASGEFAPRISTRAPG